MNEQSRDVASRLLAHRGYAAAYPENTLPALAAAVAAGARLLEFDVQLTADHVPLLLHDIDFSRTGGRPERVVDIDFAQTTRIDVAEAGRLGQKFAGVRAPRLFDIAQQLAEWPHVTAFVELKRHSLEAFGRAAVLDAVMAAIERVREQCVIISFDADVLVAARQEYSMPIGWALRAYNAKNRGRADALAPDYLFCNQARLPPTALGLWPGPWEWVVYEIVDPQVARALFARGVAIVETMAFPEMINALADHQERRA